MTIVHMGFESGNNNENDGTIETTLDDSQSWKNREDEEEF